MKALLLGVLALLALAAAPAQAAPAPMGTATLVNVPAYGGPVIVHYHLYRNARCGNSVVWCGQFSDPTPTYPGGQYEHVFMQEQGLPSTGKIKNQWDGDVTYGPLQGSYDAVWDTSKIAYCVAFAYDEGSPNGKAPVVITDGVYFTVPAVGP